MSEYRWRNIMALILYGLILIEIFLMPCWMRRFQHSWLGVALWGLMIIIAAAIWAATFDLARAWGWVH